MISFVVFKALSLFSVFVVLCAVNASEKKHSCSFESALFDDFLDMMLKIRQAGKSDSGTSAPNKNSKPVVAFSASMTKTVDVQPGHVAIFDKVWTNTHSVYNPTTGTFTAPVDGLYHFSCTVMSDNKKTLRVHLFKNNSPIVPAYTGAIGHATGTLNMILQLKKGDKVTIRKSPNEHNTIYNESHSNFSMFSGFLIA